MRKILICFIIIFLLNSVVACSKTIDESKESTTMQTEIVKYMNSMGLKRVSESISKNIRNAIKLNTRKVKEGDISIGETKIGGKPDVTNDFVWPEWNSRYLSFIAQINLEEVAQYDLEKLLPSTGVIYFFYDSNQETWGFDPKDEGSWKVIYYSGNVSGLKRAEFPKDMPLEGRFQACKVEMKSERSFPAWESVYIDELKLTEEEQDAYFDFCEEQNEDSIINKILGHPDQIQGDMQLECQLVSNGLYCGDASGYNDPKRKELEKGMKDWRLLLQIDSDENAGMMWGDVGRLYFWIKADDLAEKRFDKAWMNLQCS